MTPTPQELREAKAFLDAELKRLATPLADPAAGPLGAMRAVAPSADGNAGTDQRTTGPTPPPPDTPPAAEAPPAAEPEPDESEKPVEDAALAADLERIIRRYVYFSSPHAYTTMMLWAIHTHFTPHAGTWTPYLQFTSPRPECGKSNALDILSILAMEAEIIIGATEATARRLPHEKQGRITLLLDEADSYAGQPQWRGILNAGAKRGMRYKLQREDDKAETGWRTVELNVFCPKALAFLEGAELSKLHISTETRSLTLRMEPAPKGTIEPLALWNGTAPTDASRVLQALATRLKRWVARNIPAIKRLHEPGLLTFDARNRTFDLWLPLMVAAELLGGEWPQRAREALAWHSAQRREDGDNGQAHGLRLLRSFRALYEKEADDAFFPNDAIANALNADRDGEWADWNKGLGIRSAQVSAYLRHAFHGDAEPSKRGGSRGRTVGAMRRLWERWL